MKGIPNFTDKVSVCIFFIHANAEGFKSISDFAAVKNEKKKVEMFIRLIEELPACNRLLLSWMIVHMTHIIELVSGTFYKHSSFIPSTDARNDMPFSVKRKRVNASIVKF